jgi:hypothetical protein
MYGLSLLKGLYTDTPCKMAMDVQLEKYVTDIRKATFGGVDKSWKNLVQHSWNALLKGESGTIAKAVLMSELEAQDRIFTTHFKDATSYFMTGSEEWESVWHVYVEAIIQQVDTVAERPKSNALVKEVRERLPGKVHFVLLNHGVFHVASLFPIITRSVIPVMV